MGQKKLRFDIESDKEVSIDAINFMDKCFKWDYNDRASCDELLLHPFITRVKMLSEKNIKNTKIEINFEYELDYS